MKKKTNKTEPLVIKGFKGFDKDFKCRDKQYTENSTEQFDGTPVICSRGLHFCENPIDVLKYYPPADSRFAEVEGSGETAKETGADKDSKIACTTLKIGAEITLHKLIDAGIKFVFERTTKTKTVNNKAKNKQCGNVLKSGAASNSGDSGAASNSGYSGAASNSGYSGAASNSGYSGAASNSGYSGAASNSGDSGAASNSGDSGAASNSGDSGAAFTIGSYSAAETNAKDSVAIAVGYENKAKGNIGSWIVLAERNDNYEILDIQALLVDGKQVKENVFYQIKKGKLIEIK